MSADEARIREVIFDYLSGFSDLSTVRTKDVRNHIINTLNLPKDYFGGDAKEIMLSIISNYQIPLAVPPVAEPVIKKPHKATTPSRKREAVNSRNSTPRPADKPKPIYHSSFEDDSSVEEDKKQPNNRSSRTPTTKSNTPKKRKTYVPVDTSSDEEKPPSPTPVKRAPQPPRPTPQVDEDYPNQDGETKSGRFTKFESGCIYDAACRYAAENDIPVMELCTQFRKDESMGGEKTKHLTFWRELKELLPNRTKMAIWHHTQRLLARTKIGHGRFSTEDKRRLQELSKTHGSDIVSIAHEMGRLPDDCRQQLLRMKVRGLEGRKQNFFTTEEDEKIVKAVQEALGKPGVAILDLPTKRLPWTAVATLLNNEKLPLDYNRRYQILLRRAQGWGTSVLDCSNAYSQNSLGTMNGSGGDGKDGGGLSVRDRQIQLVDRLIEGGFEDESEVNWASLDREFNYYQTSSQLRWKGLVKMCPVNDPEIQTMEERLAYLKELLGDSSITISINTGAGAGAGAAGGIKKGSSGSKSSSSSKEGSEDNNNSSGDERDEGVGQKKNGCQRSNRDIASDSDQNSDSSSSSSSASSSSSRSNRRSTAKKSKSSQSTSQSNSTSTPSAPSANTNTSTTATTSSTKPSMKGAFTGPVLNPPRAPKTNTNTTAITSTSSSAANKKVPARSATGTSATTSSVSTASTSKKPIVTTVDSSSSDSSSSSSSDSESESNSVNPFTAPTAVSTTKNTSTDKGNNKSLSNSNTVSSGGKKATIPAAKKADVIDLASSSDDSDSSANTNTSSSKTSKNSKGSRKSVVSVASERDPLIKVKLASPASPTSSHSSSSDSDSDSSSNKADSGAESDLEKIFSPPKKPASRSTNKLGAGTTNKPTTTTFTDTKAINSASDVKLALTQVKVDSDLSDDDSTHGDALTAPVNTNIGGPKKESKVSVKAEAGKVGVGKNKKSTKLTGSVKAPLPIDQLYAVDEDHVLSSDSSSNSDSDSGSDSDANIKNSTNHNKAKVTSAATASKSSTNKPVSHIDTGTQGSELSPITHTQFSQPSQLSQHTLSPLPIQLTQTTEASLPSVSSQPSAEKNIVSSSTSTTADVVTSATTTATKKKKAKKSKKNKKRARADSSSEDSDSNDEGNDNNKNNEKEAENTQDANDVPSAVKSSKKKRGARYNKERDSLIPAAGDGAATDNGSTAVSSAALTSPVRPAPIVTSLPSSTTPSTNNHRRSENARPQAHSPYSAAAALALASSENHHNITQRGGKRSKPSAFSSESFSQSNASFSSPVRPVPLVHYGGAVSEVVRSPGLKHTPKHPQEALQHLALTGRAVIGDSIGKTLLGQGQSGKKPPSRSSSGVKESNNDSNSKNKRMSSSSVVDNSAQKKRRQG